MKITMAIPSYWGRDTKTGWQEGDAVYDHPTPLDHEGTLQRAIKSIGLLEDKDFDLVILAVPTTEEIEEQVEQKLADQIKPISSSAGVRILLFGPSALKAILAQLREESKPEYADILRLRGYSNVRNLCMFVPHVLGSEAAVLIDDDEVFEDPGFMSKAKDFIGREYEGEMANAVAGYYLQPDGDYRVKFEPQPWMNFWDQYERMNEAFDKFIGTEPRLKETPFVFGGNMVVHRNLFTRVPFDPEVPRGEDIDFLINARMFGFSFFLDNQLSIKHLPPPRSHPVWRRLREDIFRFVYERAKIERQREGKGMSRVRPEELDPYPGCFLKGDLEEKIEKASRLLSEDYLAQGDAKGSQEALRNIELATTEAVPNRDPFRHLCDLQEQWQGLMEYTYEESIRSRIKRIIQREKP